MVLPKEIEGLKKHGIYECKADWWVQVCPKLGGVFFFKPQDLIMEINEGLCPEAPVFLPGTKNLRANGFHVRPGNVDHTYYKLPKPLLNLYNLCEEGNEETKGDRAREAVCHHFNASPIEIEEYQLIGIDVVFPDGTYGEVKYDFQGGLPYENKGKTIIHHCRVIIQTHETRKYSNAKT